MHSNHARNLLPPNLYSKHAIKSRYEIIRSTFLKLQNSLPHVDGEVLVVYAVKISNTLYENNILLASEIAKGYRKRNRNNSVSALPVDVADAPLKLAAKHQLALIVNSKPIFEQHARFGDVIEIYQQTALKRRGVWSTSQITLEINQDAGLVTVPGKVGNRVAVKSEDIKKTIHQD